MRYLAKYPTTLFNGLDQPYYFVSRLTYNEPYGNIGLGDRALVIF